MERKRSQQGRTEVSSRKGNGKREKGKSRAWLWAMVCTSCLSTSWMRLSFLKYSTPTFSAGIVPGSRFPIAQVVMAFCGLAPRYGSGSSRSTTSVSANTTS